MKKYLLIFTMSVVSFLGLTTEAFATSSVSTTITATVTFANPLAISAVRNANFGSIPVGADTYVLDTSGNLTNSSGSPLTGSGRSPASFTISGSATQGLLINAGSYTADNGVTPSNATCKYGSAPAAACVGLTANAPGNGGTALVMGLTIAADGNQTGGTTANPSFTMTVNYL